MPDHPTPDPRFGPAWRDHRRYVLSIAVHMLGDVSEAEDVVQEAYVRLLRADLDEIDDVRGWLVVVTGRLCLDVLRSAHRRRRAWTDAPLDGPAGGRGTDVAPGGGSGGGTGPAGLPVDPSDRITLDDEVRTALHVVLDTLSPAERTAFVLHDVFAYSIAEVGEIVGRTPAACRQLASRARRQLRAGGRSARFAAGPTEQRRVAEGFIAACSTGDLDGLLALLDPEVSGQAEMGGRLGTVPPVVGAPEVARRILVFLGPQSATTFLVLPTTGEATIVALRAGRVFGVITLRIEGGVVDHIHTVGDPERLAPLDAALGSGS
jgi:RNA polymerase sigma-70 factor (ECF subfamily)